MVQVLCPQETDGNEESHLSAWRRVHPPQVCFPTMNQQRSCFVTHACFRSCAPYARAVTVHSAEQGLVSNTNGL
jgi:hypothetical protein